MSIVPGSDPWVLLQILGSTIYRSMVGHSLVITVDYGPTLIYIALQSMGILRNLPLLE
jgi:hypothetical protein